MNQTIEPSLLAHPLATATLDTQGNKLANLKKLAANAESLGYIVPATWVVSGEHFSMALMDCMPNFTQGRPFCPITLDGAKTINKALLAYELPEKTRRALNQCYQALKIDGEKCRLVVRSCFDHEDLPHHSFAGIFESVLNVSSLNDLYGAVKTVYASVFSERAISEIASANLQATPSMAIAVQPLLGGAGWLGGVAHTQSVDLSPFPVMLFSVASDCETVTAGSTIPEDYLLYRDNIDGPNKAIIQRQPGSLTTDSYLFSDDRIKPYAQTLIAVEELFEHPVEVEWLIGPDGCFYLLQARFMNVNTIEPIPSQVQSDALLLCEGLPVGNGLNTGTIFCVKSLGEAKKAPPGHIIVTNNTDPDWVEVVRQAAGIITAQGARTSHVSRTARESGVLAVVACGSSLDALETGAVVTIACTEGIQGAVYSGEIVSNPIHTQNNTVDLVSPISAFSIARSTQPEIVVLDLHPLLTSMLLPAPSLMAESQDPRLLRRIAGHTDLDAFVVSRLTEALALVCVAFPRATVTPNLTTEHPWHRCLDRAVNRCSDEYGFNVQNQIPS